MKNSLKVLVLLAVMMLVFASVAFADEAYPGETKFNEILAKAQAKSEANQPKVKTLDNGVRVQITPDDAGAYWQMYGYPNSYNTSYLDADNRGCQACHESLNDLMNNLSFQHLTFNNTYGIELEVQDCMICHDDGDGYLWTTKDFGTMIHGIHKNASISCWTCHNATADGKGMTLWEEAKYDVLEGISAIADVQGEFSFSQEVVTDMHGQDTTSWFSGPTTISMASAELENLPLDEGLFNSWTITVDGDVENPFTMTLPEMIETFPTVSKVMTDHCVMNPVGGPYIFTIKASGFSISELLAYAGVKEGATAVMSYASDGWNRGIYLSELEKDDAILAYEFNDERLPWAYGYPVTTINGAGSAASCIRNVVNLHVVSDEKIKVFDGWNYVDSGEYINKPNVGICHFVEGQIIEAGKPFTFEGYADAYDKAIVAVEFSMDRGNTWTRFDTTGANRDAWVYWNFTFMPEKTGSFVLSMRAETENGLVTTVPDEVLFNVK